MLLVHAWAWGLPAWTGERLAGTPPHTHRAPPPPPRGPPPPPPRAPPLQVKQLSGTKFRQMLRAGEDIPEWFAFKSVVGVLREHQAKQ